MLYEFFLALLICSSFFNYLIMEKNQEHVLISTINVLYCIQFIEMQMAAQDVDVFHVMQITSCMLNHRHLCSQWNVWKDVKRDVFMQKPPYVCQ